jgi:hypothetical protein
MESKAYEAFDEAELYAAFSLAAEIPGRRQDLVRARCSVSSGASELPGDIHYC